MQILNSLKQTKIKLRSVSKWSIGVNKLEQSIYNAYIQLIAQSKHFIYIENQFFISSTQMNSNTIQNSIVKALLIKILERHQKQRKFKVIIMMPLLPGFVGEIDGDSPVLKVQMHWQYQTLCRGENSLFGQLLQKGINPDEYVSIYGLRKHDFLDGRPVTEQIYIHSKLMIVDDTYVIIGSANINDRSMLGDRDSEIAMLIQDDQIVNIPMNGTPFMASYFAHSLRVNLFKEHFELTENELQDPLNQKALNKMELIANTNTEFYRQVFRWYHDDEVHDNKSLSEFKKQSKPELYEELKRTVQGNAVIWPQRFMEKQDLQVKIINTICYLADQITFQ